MNKPVVNRPTGVTILAVLQLIFSVLGLIGGLGVLLFGGQLAETASQQGQAGLNGTLQILGLVVVVSSLIGILLAWGLFTLKGWAWITTLIFQGLGILSNLASLAQGSNAGGAVFSIVISGVIIYYLLRPEVKQAFGK